MIEGLHTAELRAGYVTELTLLAGQVKYILSLAHQPHRPGRGAMVRAGTSTATVNQQPAHRLAGV